MDISTGFIKMRQKENYIGDKLIYCALLDA